MEMKRTFFRRLYVVGCLGAATGLMLTLAGDPVTAHQNEHTAKQLQLFDKLFMDQVKVGDALFHGDPGTIEQMGVNLSNTGMACAMCHPYASDTHPHEYPKWQEQMSKFATLRDMINWCIEKPNEGEILDDDSPAMKALEAYIYWSNRNSPLRPGTH